MIRWLAISALTGATCGALLQYSRDGALIIGAAAGLVILWFGIKAGQETRR